MISNLKKLFLMIFNVFILVHSKISFLAIFKSILCDLRHAFLDLLGLLILLFL
jgi:hypothetical protein